MVVDDLIQVSMGYVTDVVDNKQQLVKELHRLSQLSFRLEDS